MSEKTIEVGDRFLALAACNSNPKYLDCVETFIKFWEVIGRKSNEITIEPHIFMIMDEVPTNLFKYRQYMTIIQPASIDTALVAQLSRVLYAGEKEAKSIMLTDIDMVPLRRNIYYKNFLRTLGRGNTIVVLRDVLEPGEYPICYNFASPDTWDKLNMSDQPATRMKTEVSSILEEFGGKYEGVHGGIGWNIDQRYLYSRIEEKSSQLNVIRLADPETGHRRLDRNRHRFPRNWVVLPLIILGRYTDFHLMHPVASSWRFNKTVLVIIRIHSRAREWIRR